MALIAAAAILDGLDGRVARILDAQSRMGAEIDSLADAVNFGVTPAIVLYVTLLSTSPAGWIVVLLYAVCVVLRLARYNALQDDGTQPAYAHEFFVGMPAPAGAVSMIGLIGLKLQFGEGWWTLDRVPVHLDNGDVDADGEHDPDAEDARRGGTAELGGPAAGNPGDLRGGRGAGPLHLDLGDHHRLPVPRPVRGPQPALAGQAPRGVGRKTRATARRAAREPPGAAEPPADRAAWAGQAGRAFDGTAGTAQAGRAIVMNSGSGTGQLTLTARLNTSAVDSRRGVVRLHPNAVAALGIREWDAVSLTGSRTTAAVAGLGRQDTPVGTVLLDDVTLSNAGLREGTEVIVSAVIVYGARTVTLSGSGLATQSLSPAHPAAGLARAR